MKFINLTLFLSVFLLSGCATTYKTNIDYKQGYNFNQIKTFYIHNSYATEDATKEKVNRFVSDLDNDRLISAINANLQGKGLLATTVEEADIVVKYLVTSKDKTRIRSFNTGFNSCWHCRGFYGAHGSSDINVKQYVEGTIIIDLVDPKLNKSVWRSVVSSAIKNKTTVAEKQIEMQQAVDAMLADFKKPKEVLKTTNN